VDIQGLEGDKHRNRAVHGGPQRAVCLLALEVIEKLQREGHAVEPGSLGENLTISGLDWAMVRPGHRLRVGNVLLEVTGFTTPCQNVAENFANRDFTRIWHAKNPGEARLYARVVRSGEVAPGMDVEHLPAAVVASPAR
jgi:MOSC domain-containing protein YiiM